MRLYERTRSAFPRSSIESREERGRVERDGHCTAAAVSEQVVKRSRQGLYSRSVPGTGAYPGSFSPLHVAHLGIAQAARDRFELERVDLIVSRVALGKESVDRPRLEERVEVLRRAASTRPWLGVVVTDRQLLADIASGYDVLILGADKWAQVLDPIYYGDSEEERDSVVARLPRLAIVPRAGFDVPAGSALEIAPALQEVSSTGARAGRREWMSEEAAALDSETGAWSDPARYEMWLLNRPSGASGPVRPRSRR